MYRLSLSKPGAAQPYLTIYSRPAGRYDRQEYAPLGGTVEMLRGDFCGGGSIRLSAPPPFVAGDWLRVWLPGDAADDPTYLGEIGGEPWQEGAGDVPLRPLSDTVKKARWSGVIEENFAGFLAYAISHCTLPPGVTIGAIPADLATLKANTAFELLGDTLQAAMPVIEGGTSGTDAGARIGIYRPDATLTHRFVLGQAALTPGDTNNYANCVRFPFKQPDGTDTWFEGRVESEVAARGEVWEVTQVPASVTDAAENPLEGLSAGVTLTGGPAGARATQSLSVPIFATDFTSTLGAAAVLSWQTLSGSLWRPPTPDAGMIEVELGAFGGGGSFRSALLMMRLDYSGASTATVVETSVYRDDSYATGWTSYSAMYGSPNTETGLPGIYLLQTDGTNSTKLRLRYTQTYIDTYKAANGGQPPKGIDLLQGGYVNYTNIHQHLDDITVVRPTVSINGVLSQAQINMALQQAYSVDVSGVDGKDSGAIIAAAPLTFDSPAIITLPAPIFLQAGAAILVRDTSSTVGAGVTGVKLITSTGDKPLAAATAEGDMTKWTFPGPDVQVWGLRIMGNPAKVGRVIARLTSTANLAAYGYGLLRYRTQPVRSWTGMYRRLKRVACSGVARFETLNGEVDLDVQRVTYNLTDGTVSVEAGTPQASTDAEALAAAIQDVRQETRKATGG